jgi:hypothetical protein
MRKITVRAQNNGVILNKKNFLFSEIMSRKRDREEDVSEQAKCTTDRAKFEKRRKEFIDAHEKLIHDCQQSIKLAEDQGALMVKLGEARERVKALCLEMRENDEQIIAIQRKHNFPKGHVHHDADDDAIESVSTTSSTSSTQIEQPPVQHDQSTVDTTQPPTLVAIRQNVPLMRQVFTLRPPMPDIQKEKEVEEDASGEISNDGDEQEGNVSDEAIDDAENENNEQEEPANDEMTDDDEENDNETEQELEDPFDKEGIKGKPIMIMFLVLIANANERLGNKAPEIGYTIGDLYVEMQTYNPSICNEFLEAYAHEKVTKPQATFYGAVNGYFKVCGDDPIFSKRLRDVNRVIYDGDTRKFSVDPSHSRKTFHYQLLPRFRC